MGCRFVQEPHQTGPAFSTDRGAERACLARRTATGTDQGDLRVDFVAEVGGCLADTLGHDPLFCLDLLLGRLHRQRCPWCGT